MRLSMSRANRPCVIAVVTGGLSLAAVLFTQSEANADKWCGRVGLNSRNCGYHTYQQCHASSRSCYQNPRYGYHW
jgi:Protein of unknown function (DUF3551)